MSHLRNGRRHEASLHARHQHLHLHRQAATAGGESSFRGPQAGTTGPVRDYLRRTLLRSLQSSQRAKALAQLEELVQDIPVENLDATVARAYGKIRAALEESGRVIGNNDLWIGAHALALDVTLATNNEREFNRIAGLSVENWARRA